MMIAQEQRCERAKIAVHAMSPRHARAVRPKKIKQVAKVFPARHSPIAAFVCLRQSAVSSHRHVKSAVVPYQEFHRDYFNWLNLPYDGL